MKNLTLVTLLVASLLLVGCGAKPTDTATPDGDSAAVVNTADADANADSATPPAEDTAPTAEVDLEKTTKLADCLTEKKMTMYGTERCGHCKNQKELFGEAFAKVTYVDCDAQRQTCLDAGVRGFPTWIDGQGNQYPGTQQLEKLAEVAGCEM